MFDSDERSSLWGLAAGGSLIGGAAYFFNQNKNGLSRALKSGGNKAASVSSRIASSPGFNTISNIPSSVISARDDISSLVQSYASSVGNTTAVSDIKHLTYQSAMAGRIATHREAIAATSRVGGQGSALEAYEAAIEQLGVLKGDVSTFESGLKSLSQTDRLDMLGRVATSEGGTGTGFKYSQYADLPSSARARFERLSTNLQQALGKGRIDWKFKNVEDVISGQNITTPMAIANVAGESFNIPLADTGYTYGGKAFTSRYATRGGYSATGYQMGYSELSEEILRDAISGSKNNFDMKQRLSQAHQSLIDQMNARDSSARAAGVWTLPESVMPSGGRARARLIAQEAVSFGGASEDEVIDLLGQGLYPYTSPTAAGKGTLATKNLATGLYGPLGTFMSAEQRPTQFIRGEWGVTARAKSKSKPFRGTFGQSFSRLDRKLKGELYDPLIYGKGATAASTTAYSAPQLVTFYAKPNSTGYGLGYQADALNQMLAAEEGVISKSVVGSMEYERVFQKKIALDEGLRANKQILSGLTGKGPGTGVIPMNIGAGQFIGIEKGTGKEITTGLGDALTDVIGAEVTGKNEATVFLRERRTLSEDQWWKFFSEENKFMAAAADERRMRSVLNAAGLGDIKRVGGQSIEAVFSGKLVARNKTALLNQQIEAASMLLSSKIDRGKIPLSSVQQFLDDPTAALNVKKLLASHASDADVQIQKNLLGLTREWGFTGFETQMTFGLMDPKVASQLESEMGYKGFARLVERSRGVIGLGKMRLGDIATEGGAGRIGSFETTGFRALAMKGETGEKFAAELSQRILGKGELGAADKMFASVIGEQSILDKLKPNDLENLSDLSSSDVISSKGRYVNLGRSFESLGRSSMLYIPGIDEAPGMLNPIITPSGERVQSPLTQSLMSFRSSLRRHAAGRMQDEEIEQAASVLRNAVAQASEEQAYARGRILGSRALTGIRRTFTEDSDAFRISRQTAEEMFDELLGRASSKSQIEFLQQQKQSLLEGQTIMGGMWRHPTTGPESFQFIKYKVDRDLANGLVAAPKEFGKLQFSGMDPRDVDVSSMVGFKGDFDRDQFVISAIANRDTANRVGKQIDSGIRENYNRYLFNHYAIKDSIEGRMSKKDVLNMTSKEALETGYRKLTTAKTATGRVNLALQKLKMGVSSVAPDQYRPLAEMFWHLEEAAIGGKHGVLETELYQAITHAVDKGGSEGIRNMEAVMRSLMGDKRTISGSIIDSFGNKVAHQIQYDPRQWAETAISSYDAVRGDVNTVMRAASTAKGKTDATLNQLVEQFHARRSGSVDISQSLMQAGAQNVDDFTVKASRRVRQGATKANSLLSVFKRGKKPLMMGAAAAAGIMLMAPGTSGTLRKPEGVSGGRNLPPEDFGPPSGGPMQPPPSGPNRSPRLYDIGSGNRTSHANIRMRINDLDSSSRDFMASARALSDGSRVNINARDDRSILDPRSLASKIHERL